MIRFFDVTKSYGGDVNAVDHLNLTIEQGSFTVFVGPSGCGKTTSMRMINRMISPTSGVLEVNGTNVMDVDPVRLRLGIGYVIQHAGLMPHRRIIDNVAVVPRLLGVDKKVARAQAMDALERVGIDLSMGQRFPSELSGGQQQRVGVARALAANPPILLMDEPFSAVDPVVREDLQTEMLRLQSELQKTIVFVTHDIDEAIKLGDKVAVFGVGGKLQQYGTPQDVLTAPASDWVASFVGRDRGYRALGFRDASDVPIRDIATVNAQTLSELRLAPNAWSLFVDQDRRPLGWINDHVLSRVQQGEDVADALVAGGSLFQLGGTLRQALDAGLSSPAEIGVVVDEHGAVSGAVYAPEVVSTLKAERQAELAQETLVAGETA